jgi:hypothetical protein
MQINKENHKKTTTQKRTNSETNADDVISYITPIFVNHMSHPEAQKQKHINIIFRV